MSSARDPERYRRAKSIFLHACEQPGSERSAFVVKACAGDDALREEVAELLALDSGGSPGGSSHTAIDDGHPPLFPSRDPQTIAGYRILGRLGEGGMGIVFDAEEASPRRRVALKVIRGDLVSPRQRRRFEFEAEVLAQLEHPGIARIYAAGTDDHGRPYFAMERVEGVDLLRAGNERALDLHARVRVFIEVCDAVHHAHQRGVIHRDLKPNNVLLSGENRPKILDFGIARVTEGDLRAATIQTAEGQIVGTVPYMSPEQASGDSSALDTRSDVYALGVVLFEFLTGQLPYELPDRGVAEALDVVRHREPVRAGRLRPELRGDLETILGKALEKEITRRYSSAQELSDDLRRYLRDEPIVARPASALYQLGKFARRNRWLVAAGLASSVILIVSFIVVLFTLGREIDARRLADERLEAVTEAETIARANLERARDARRETESQLEAANTLVDFLLLDVFGATRPLGGPTHDLPLSAVLSIASGKVDERFASQPLIAASIRGSLGQSFIYSGENEAARRELEAALALVEPILGLHHRDVISIRSNLALIESREGRLARAERTLYEILPFSVLYYSHFDGRTRTILGNLSSIFRSQGRSEEAVALLRYLVESESRSYTTDRKILTARVNLAAALTTIDEHEEALTISREASANAVEWLGADDPTTLIVQRGQADILRAADREDEARPLLEQCLADHLRAYGAGHVEVLKTRIFLADCCIAQGDLERAEAELREVLAEVDRLRSASPDTARRLFSDWASLESARGNRDAAADYEGAAVKIAEETYGPKSAQALRWRRGWLRRLTTARRYPEAIEVGRELLRTLSLPGVADPSDRAEAARLLARALRRHDQLDEAQRLLLSFLEPEEVSLSLPPEDVERLEVALAMVERERDDHRTAAHWLGRAIERRRARLGESDPSTLDLKVDLGLALRRAGRLMDAAEQYRSVLPHATLTPKKRNDALTGLVIALRDLEQYEEAIPYALEQRRLLEAEEETTTASITRCLDRIASLYSGLEDHDRHLEIRLQRLVLLEGSTAPQRTVLNAQYDLGVAYLDAHRLAEALATFEATLNEHRTEFGNVHSKTAAVKRRLSIVHRQLNNFERAEQFGLEAHRNFVETEGTTDRSTLRARTTLARLYEAWGRPEDAKRWEQPPTTRSP